MSFPNPYHVDRWTLRFIQSDFKGQLPHLYSHHSNSTSIIPDHMNDMNHEEPSRYVSWLYTLWYLKLACVPTFSYMISFMQFPLTECHFLVDLDLSETTPLQPRYSQDTAHWETVLKRPFLDAGRLVITWSSNWWSCVHSIWYNSYFPVGCIPLLTSYVHSIWY